MKKVYSLFALVLCCLPIAGYAESQQFGEYEVHYSAFNSSFLAPEVARQYGLTRSRYGAIVNVAVRKKTDSTQQTVAHTALVKGEITNLLQQRETLNFVEVEEGDAIYYLAECRFTTDKPIKLLIDVQPDINQPAYSVSMDKRFLCGC